MQTKRILKVCLIAVAACVSLGGVAYGAILWHIDESAKQRCSVAQEAHPYAGDDISSLSEFMNCDGHSLRERNLAIWTLGHLRDPAALPALESVYTGGECDHDTQLCQYELQKAIELCGGTLNPPRKTRQGTVEQEH